MSKLYRARSLLYRRQILQVNIRWKALGEIYKIYVRLHRSDLNISEIVRQIYFRIFRQNFAKFRYLGILFTDFCSGLTRQARCGRAARPARARARVPAWRVVCFCTASLTVHQCFLVRSSEFSKYEMSF